MGPGVLVSGFLFAVLPVAELVHACAVETIWSVVVFPHRVG
jgi:hypothetical protein